MRSNAASACQLVVLHVLASPASSSHLLFDIFVVDSLCDFTHLK
jgi:hypothetical protein